MGIFLLLGMLGKREPSADLQERIESGRRRAMILVIVFGAAGAAVFYTLGWFLPASLFCLVAALGGWAFAWIPGGRFFLGLFTGLVGLLGVGCSLYLLLASPS